MNCFNTDEADIKCTARHLRTTFSSETKHIRDLTEEVKILKRISKTFPVCNASDSTVGEVRRRLREIDKILPTLCLTTEELGLLQRLCHHGDEVSPDPEKMYPESYGFVLDSMAQYEANCRQKERLENLINQVHIQLMKAEACTGSSHHKAVLYHSKSVDSEELENIPPKPCMSERRQSADNGFPYSISLFPELSIETLEIAEKEFHRRRPLQTYPQNGAVPKETSSVGPFRKLRSPGKSQAGTAVYSPMVKDGGCPNVQVSLNRSLSRVRSPMLNSFLKKEQKGDVTKTAEQQKLKPFECQNGCTSPFANCIDPDQRVPEGAL